ncbi:unnamed protein product [Cochlearia groenlandica]
MFDSEPGKVVPDSEKAYEYCESDIATSYGAGAFVLLLTSQVIIMVASRCFCCGKHLTPVVLGLVPSCSSSFAGSITFRAILLDSLIVFHESDLTLYPSLFAVLGQRVFFLIAEVCLLAASIRNAYHTKYIKMWKIDKPSSCEVIRKGVFAAGASFALFTAIVSQFYYVCYSRARDDYKNPPY